MVGIAVAGFAVVVVSAVGEVTAFVAWITLVAWIAFAITVLLV